MRWVADFYFSAAPRASWALWRTCSSHDMHSSSPQTLRTLARWFFACDLLGKWQKSVSLQNVVLKSNVMLSYNRKEQKQLLPPLFNAKNIAQKSKKNENNIKRPFPLVPVKDCLVWALHYTKKSKKQKKNELNFSISQFARQTEQLFALIIHLLRQWSKDCLKSD